MPVITFNCPTCNVTLKSSNPVPAGKKMKCPKCAAFFPMPASDSAAISSGPPRAAPAPRPVTAVVVATPVDADEDDDVEIAARARPRKRKQKSNTGLIVGLVLGGVGLLLLVGLGVTGLMWVLKSSGSVAAKDWKEFQSPPGRFRVMIPGTPAQKPQSLSSPVGLITGQEYTLVFPPPRDLGYEVSYLDLPATLLRQLPVAQHFNNGRDGFLSTKGGSSSANTTSPWTAIPGARLSSPSRASRAAASCVCISCQRACTRSSSPAPMCNGRRRK
jgi:hypothetical protein